MYGVLLPKCENEQVHLVLVDLCRVVLRPCRLAAQVGGLVLARFSMNGVCGSGSSTQKHLIQIRIRH